MCLQEPHRPIGFLLSICASAGTVAFVSNFTSLPNLPFPFLRYTPSSLEANVDFPLWRYRHVLSSGPCGLRRVCRISALRQRGREVSASAKRERGSLTFPN